MWIIAVFIEYIAPSFGFWTPLIGRSSTNMWDVEGSHMAERCGLFIIIALGESILVTGATFAKMEWSLGTLGSFIISFSGTVAMCGFISNRWLRQDIIISPIPLIPEE